MTVDAEKLIEQARRRVAHLNRDVEALADRLASALREVQAIQPAVADRDRLAAAAEYAVSEVAEYSEADSPADLPGAVAWLIREDTRSRMRAAAAVADRDRLADALREIVAKIDGADQAFRWRRVYEIARAALAAAGKAEA